MKTLRPFLFLGLVVALWIPGSARATGDEAQPARTPFSVINQAAASGELTEAHAALYRFYALYAPEKLPAGYRVEGGTPLPCGTPTVVEALQQLSSMSAAEQQEVRDRLARPNLDSYIDTAHFRVHYSTSGTNKIYGWPNTAYRDTIVAGCERSYALYVAQGWPAPPPDGTSGGGSNLIDCYVDFPGSGAMGVTFAETPIGVPYQYSYTAYFIVGYNLTLNEIRVTVAHEYHHVVQMGMNAQTASWWMENSATWAQDYVYDQINYYIGYLRNFFARPWNGLRNADGQWEYACVIWPMYLDDRFGGYPIVRDVWLYDAVNVNLTNAFNNIIHTYNPSWDATVAWDQAVNEWARWNYFSCDRDDGNHYEEGSLWRDNGTCIWLAFDGDINTYPQTNVHPSTGKWPQSLGTNYTRFRQQSGSTDNHLTVTFTGLNACEYNWQLIFVRKFAGQNVFEEYVVPIDASGHATFDLNRWDQTDHVYMGVELKRACGSSGKDFSYSASTTFTMDVADGTLPTRIIRLDQNAPNPFNPVTTIKYATSTTAPVRIDVFDAAGRHVRTLLDGTQTSGEHQVRWFGDDAAGRHVPGGLYLYSVRVGNEIVSRKMLMVE